MAEFDWDEILVSKDPKKKEVAVNFKAVDGQAYPGSPASELCVRVYSNETFVHTDGSAHWVWLELSGVPDRYVKATLTFDSGVGIAPPASPRYAEWYPGDDQIIQFDLNAGDSDELLDGSTYRATVTVEGSSCEVSQATVTFAKDVTPPEPSPEPIPEDTGGDPLPGSNPECGTQDCNAWDVARADTTVETTGVVTLRNATDPAFIAHAVQEYELLSGQTTVGYRVLHPDGTPSDFVAQREPNLPSENFGSAFLPAQEACSANYPCGTNPNIMGTEERLQTGKHWEGTPGSRVTNPSEVYCISEQDSPEVLGLAQWPFKRAETYQTRQSLSDFICVIGSAGSPTGRYNDYRSEANLSFTACTVEDRPTDTTVGYFGVGVNAVSTIRFQQVTSGYGGDFKIQKFNTTTSQYEDVTPDGWLRGRDFLKIKHTKEIAVGWASSMPVNGTQNYLTATDTTNWAIKNLITGEEVFFKTVTSYTVGDINAWWYCIPQHPVFSSAAGVLYGWKNAGSGVFSFRLAVTDTTNSEDSAYLIERSISNYQPPTHCTRIP